MIKRHIFYLEIIITSIKVIRILILQLFQMRIFSFMDLFALLFNEEIIQGK